MFRKKKDEKFSFFKAKEDDTSLYEEAGEEIEEDEEFQEESAEYQEEAVEYQEEAVEYEEEPMDSSEYVDDAENPQEEYEEEYEEDYEEEPPKKKGLFGFFKKKKAEEEYEDDSGEEYEEEEYAEESEDYPEDDGNEYFESREDETEEGTAASQSDGDESPADEAYEPEGVWSEEGYYEFEEEKKRLPKKKLLIVAGVAVIIIAAVAYFMISNIKGGDNGEAYVQSVKDIIGYGSNASNRYTGEVEPQDSWKITLQSDLSVEKCFVSVGDEVKKGDKLFSYNTEELKLAKDKKELEMETLKNENTQLTRDISTYQGDLKSASASEKIELQTQILTAQTTIKKNEFSIKSAKEDIKKLNKNIKDATVTSKMNGVVKSINAALGSSGDSDDEGNVDSGDNSTYMTILAVGDYRVKGKVSETNIRELSEGDEVIVRSRVDDTAVWKGTISKINTDGTADSEDSEMENEYKDEGMGGESASSYYFYVSLKSDEGLMMGQHVLVEPDNGQSETKEGIWLPSAYLKIDGENYYAWVSGLGGRLKLQKITVGEYNEELDEYEILKGLKLDDYIACDADNLTEGMNTTKEIAAENNTGDYPEDESWKDEPADDSYDESYEDEDFEDVGVDPDNADEGVVDFSEME